MNVRRIISAVVTALLLVAFLAPVASAEAPTLQAGALLKIEPSLRPLATSGGSQLVHVLITAQEGTQVEQYMQQSFARNSGLTGEQFTFGFMRASNLTKVAGMKGVTSVQPIVLERNGPVSPPADFQRQLDLETLQARFAELKADAVPYAQASELKGREDGAITGWHDVGPTHKSSLAWDKGYRGEGVLVAVADDGVDYPHPDLMGTWAVVEDPESPYYGWPMMFSPISMYLYALDNYFGYNYMASNTITWYSDTSATPAVSATPAETAAGKAHLTYSPVGGDTSEEHTYVIPATSVSGVYHVGSHPDDNLAAVLGEAVAVLLVDENTAGVYDTVYVDLDGNYDFTDEKPVTKDSPASYRDINDDGYTDISGGLVYFIADGVNYIPASDWLYGDALTPVPGNGDLVAFHGAFDAGYTHGTQCASNVVGQGVLTAMAPVFSDLPGDGTPGGMVVGAAPDAKVVGISDIYYNFDASKLDTYLFSVIGYDGTPGSGDEMQVVSNSYGGSDQDNDGWEYDGSYLDRVVRAYSPTTSFLFSTGNGAPGFGTAAPPSPSVGIAVGASTQFGSTGWDSITSTTQILYNDVIPFSNRGPGADGSIGVDIVADGAYAAGAEGINYFGFDGAYSWDSWGGTSRSAPVASGNMALIYQAYKAKHGTWPTYEVARALMMSGATNLNYDVLTQGAGAVNADRATDVAGGHNGFYAQPSTWQPGDYRGSEYPGFTNILGPGQSDTQTFTLTNDSDKAIKVSLTDGWMRLVDSQTFEWTSSPIDEESAYNGLVVPDYLIPIDAEDIPAGTDLMVVRMNYPFEQFDINGNYSRDTGDPENFNSEWRLLVYNWTDVDGDGLLWDDVDENGVVNHVNSENIKNADWSYDLDWANSEIDQYEYMRFGYNRPSGSTFQMWVREPLEQMADGLFIGLQHSMRNASQPTTDMTFEIAFYSYTDWDWLSLDQTEMVIPAASSIEFQGTLAVPEGTPYGGYEGAILVQDAAQSYVTYLPMIVNDGTGAMANGGAKVTASAYQPHVTVIPVYVSVAATWDGTGSVEFGGAAADDPDALYSNGSVRGLYDWSWRAESGDWRFFFMDVTEQPATGTKMVVRSEWGDAAPTDIDTVVLGPVLDEFTDSESTRYDPDYYGPYTLDTIGKSPNRNVAAGIWRFDTATGGAEDWVTASLNEGLHQVLMHNVLHSGVSGTVPFTVTVGTVAVDPITVNLDTDSDSGSFVITFTSGIELDDLAVEAFGLSAPEIYEDQTVTQSDTQEPGDDPLNEANGWKLFPFSLEHASSATIWTDNATTNDIDMYVFFDANADGVFSYPDEVLSSSATGTSSEFVRLLNPEDGDYLVGVFGWDVTGGGTYDLFIQSVQGNDLTVSGAPDSVTPGTPVVLTVDYSKTMTAGSTYYGALTLGPSVAPGAVVVPIAITRQ